MGQTAVFVTGVTGRQGGAVARELLKLNFVVHGISRMIDSDSSRSLQALGVVLYPGDWDNLDALTTATKGCTFLFLNSSPSHTDFEAELRQTRNILMAAKASGVKHILHSSVIGVNHPEVYAGLPKDSFFANYFRSKHAMEEEVRSEKWAQGWTIVRGAQFMTNYLIPSANYLFPELVADGTLVTAYTPQSKLHLIHPGDIGRFAAAVFQDTGRFDKKETDLVVEALSVEEIAEKLARVARKDVKAIFRTDEQIKDLEQVNPTVMGQMVMRHVENLVDLEQAREWDIPLRTLDEFLLEEKDMVQKIIGGP